ENPSDRVPAAVADALRLPRMSGDVGAPATSGQAAGFQGGWAKARRGSRARASTDRPGSPGCPRRRPRMARSHRLAFSSLALALAASAGALAAMPESEFRSLLEKYDERMTELRKSRGSLDQAVELQVEFSKQIPIGELTLNQLRDVSNRGLITTYKRGGEHDRTEEALKVVEPLTKGTSIEAIEALSFKATLLVSDDEARQAQLVDTLEATLSHAALPEALRENRVPDLWYTIGYQTPEEGFPELTEELSSAAARFPADADPGACGGMTTVYE